MEKATNFKDVSDNVAFLHDPLVIGCLIDPSFCTFETIPIEPVMILKEDENRVVVRTIPHM